MKTLSGNEYILADRLIKEMLSRHKLCDDPEDCYSELWRSYLEARNTYRKFEGCCSFETYAEYSLEAGLENMRKRRNDMISLKSKLSLDGYFYDSDERIIDHIPSKTGDCTRYVELMDYIDRMEKEKRSVAMELYRGMTDEEIIEDKCMEPTRYYKILEQLQRDFAVRQEI